MHFKIYISVKNILGLGALSFKNNSFEEWVVCIFTNGFFEAEMFWGFQEMHASPGLFPIYTGGPVSSRFVQMVSQTRKWEVLSKQNKFI